MSHPDNRNSGAFAGGIILLCIGLIFLLNNLFHYLNIGILWPLFLLLPAFLFVFIWVKDRRRYYPLLFPATILAVYALYFLWLNLTGWFHVQTTWPTFLMGPALGFIVLYFPKREWGFLLPALVLFVLAAIFYSELIDISTTIISVLFMGAGVLLVFSSLRKGPSRGPEAKKPEEHPGPDESSGT